MVRFTTFFIAAAFCIMPACGLFTWSPVPADGDTLQACVGSGVVFDWNFTLGAGDHWVEVIRWNIDDGRSNQMIATFTHGTFFTSPTFSGRVHHLGDARLALDSVTRSDAGNYTVEVSVHHAAGTFAEEHRSVQLTVTAPPVTRSSQLAVSQSRKAVYSNVTQDWRIKLTCGDFTDLGQPQVDVTWKTPSGSSVPSSNYDNGYFELLLENPVEGGNYTCSLGPASPARVCYHDDHPVLTGTTVRVDEKKARMSLLEAGLLAQNVELQKQNTELKAALQRQGELHQRRNEELKANLTHQLFSLQSKLDHFQETASARVTFHAHLSSDVNRTDDLDPIVLTQVLTNEGNAYNNTSGRFTAPRNGTYSFYASAGASGDPDSTGMYMMMDNEKVSGTWSTYTANATQTSSFHAVLHLVEGQEVWLRPYGPSISYHYWEGVTYFSGFLLQADE